MRIVPPTYQIITDLDGNEGILMLSRLERAGRTCYKSDSEYTAQSAVAFVQSIMNRGHESVIEHESVSVRIVCDRGVSHEIVRHRLASYSQESTRYCNYAQGKHGSEITFIDPRGHVTSEELYIWQEAMEHAERLYFEMVAAGAKPQMARSVLPNSLKTEIVMTANLREWRHFFKLRADKAAHPQMRQIAIPMLVDFQKKIPVVFDDILEIVAADKSAHRWALIEGRRERGLPE